jgi:hypothetical protein
VAITKTDGTSQHADFDGRWIQIFRAGTYGEKGKFTEADLDRVVANYNPDLHEAPAVVGHPKDNLPAFGWTRQLKRDGQLLLAKFSQVNPAFEKAVDDGLYKKRSAAFYLDDQGRITNLRHVGFLGAMPPDVKGLEDLNLKFEDNGRKFTEVDFGEEAVVDNNSNDKSTKVQFTEWLKELLGGGAKETKTFSEDDVKKIVTEAVTAAATPLQAKVKELEETTAKQTAAFAEREQKIATGEVKQRAIVAVNKLRTAGKWVPAFDRMGLALVFEELAPLTKTIEFGEGDAKKTLTPLDTLVTFLEGLPKIVPVGTVFDGKLSPEAGKKTVQFTEGKGVKADPNSIALNDLAEKIMKEKKISFGEALDQAVSDHPELTIPGTGTAGSV